MRVAPARRRWWGTRSSWSAGGPAALPRRTVTPTEVFDGTSWHDAAGIPVPGDHLAAASDGTYLYAVGGRKLEVTANTAAVQRFDPNADQWTQLTAAPGPVSDAARRSSAAS